jgi:hypothetical protein
MWSLPNLNHLHIFLDGLSKITKILSQDSRFGAEFWTRDLSNTKQGRESLDGGVIVKITLKLLTYTIGRTEEWISLFMRYGSLTLRQ